MPHTRVLPNLMHLQDSDATKLNYSLDHITVLITHLNSTPVSFAIPAQKEEHVGGRPAMQLRYAVQSAISGLLIA